MIKHEKEKLKKNLKMDEFEFLKKLSNGPTADMFLSKNRKTGTKLYAIKRMRLKDQDCEEDFEKNLNIFEKIVSIDPKPRAFPSNYYGYEKEVDEFKQITFQVVFDYYPHSLKSLISEKKLTPNASPFQFSKIHNYFKRLVNGLAFLQTLQVCHRDLKSANLLLDETLENIYLMDFRKSNETYMTKKQMALEGILEYSSPEMYKAFKKAPNINVEFNPYKSDVFSLGLIMLEMINFTIPERDIDFDLSKKNIEDALDETQKKYENILNKNEEMDELKNFIKTLRKCLSIDPKDRPDFISLFKNSLKAVNDYDLIKAHILIEDFVKLQSSKFDSVKIPASHNFELRSQNKAVFVKICSKREKIPLLNSFNNEM